MDTVDSDESLDEPFRRDSPRSCYGGLRDGERCGRDGRPGQPVAAHARRRRGRGRRARRPSRPLAERLVRLARLPVATLPRRRNGLRRRTERDRSHLHPRSGRHRPHAARHRDGDQPRRFGLLQPLSATGTVTALSTSGPHNTVPPAVTGSPVSGGRLAVTNGAWTEPRRSALVPVAPLFVDRRHLRRDLCPLARVPAFVRGREPDAARARDRERPGRLHRRALRPHCPDREGVVPCAAEPLPAQGSGAGTAG